jgi:hypothetical protein
MNLRLMGGTLLLSEINQAVDQDMYFLATDMGTCQDDWYWAVKLNRMQQMEHGVESFATFYRWHGRYQEGEKALELAMRKLADPRGDRALKLPVSVLIWRDQIVHVG